MTHYVDDRHHGFSSDIYKEALKSLGLRANSKETVRLIAEIVGCNNQKDRNDPVEILAYSAEKHSIKRDNKLSAETVRLLKERIG